LATYPAPILTIFETKDVNQCAHMYTSPVKNLCAGVFRGPKRAKMSNFKGLLVVGYSSNETISGNGNHFVD